MLSRLATIALVTLCWTAQAADPALDALRQTLAEKAPNSTTTKAARGATLALTTAKHQLRDWIESQLHELPQDGDEGLLKRKINSELRASGLLCAKTQSCDDSGLSNLLGDVTLRRQSPFLVLQTAFGIQCGLDESAYVYSWSSEGWRRVWQAEQDTYTEKAYKPQVLTDVLISPYNRADDYMVLTLGIEPWCTSNWHDVYYRVYRLGPDLEPKPLVDGDEWAYLGNRPIQGSITSDDALVEFTTSSIDGGVLIREAIRHFSIDHGKVKRIDPLALSPRDFVDEWLIHPWRESVFWSESAQRATMMDAHLKLHKDVVAGEFIYPTMHCPATPDLWQVGVDFSDSPTDQDTKPKGTYFLVRWRPPYHFTMVQVTDQPVSACNEEDRRADDERRTLFPVHDSR